MNRDNWYATHALGNQLLLLEQARQGGPDRKTETAPVRVESTPWSLDNIVVLCAGYMGVSNTEECRPPFQLGPYGRCPHAAARI